MHLDLPLLKYVYQLACLTLIVLHIVMKRLWLRINQLVFRLYTLCLLILRTQQTNIIDQPMGYRVQCVHRLNCLAFRDATVQANVRAKEKALSFSFFKSKWNLLLKTIQLETAQVNG